MDRRIFVVEDDPFIRICLTDIIVETGLDVREFGNADDAWSALGADGTQVAGVITDIQMDGDMDGVELAQRIHRQWPKLPVLVTSGRPDRADELPEGIRFMAKPLLPLNVISFVTGAALGPDGSRSKTAVLSG